MTSALLTVLCSLVGPLQRKPSYRAASWPRRGSRGQDLTEARGREWGTEGLSPMVQRRWILPTMPWGSGEVDLPSADPWDNCSLDWYLDYSLWKTLNQKRPAKLCPEPNRRNCEITNACRFKPFSFRLICFEAVQLWTGSISNSRLIIWGPKEKGKKKKIPWLSGVMTMDNIPPEWKLRVRDMALCYFMDISPAACSLSLSKSLDEWVRPGFV